MRDIFCVKTVGRRKNSVAILKLIPGSGQLKVNGKSVQDFFAKDVHRISKIYKPLWVSMSVNFDVTVKIQGGGLQSQASALQLALIRALIRGQPKNRQLFRKYIATTSDSRSKERRKYGLKKARKSPQFSKRSTNFKIAR